MTHSISNYRTIILCESVMIYSALAATIYGANHPHHVYKSCSGANIRYILMRNCEHHKGKRSLFVVPENKTETNLDMPFYQKFAYNNKLPRIPDDLLPPNVAMIAKLVKSKRVKRNSSKSEDFYSKLIICCKNPNYCDSLPCTNYSS